MDKVHNLYLSESFIRKEKDISLVPKEWKGKLTKDIRRNHE